MKTKTNLARRVLQPAAAVGLGAMLISAGTAAVTATDQDTGFAQKVERWQNKMSEAFRDTWKDLRGDSDKTTVSAASVDLREQKEAYTVRLNLPNHDLAKVVVTLDGDTLHIVAPAENKISRYEQTVTLSGVAPDAKPKIDRMDKDGIIVVTVPKGTAIAETPPLTVPGNTPTPLTDWDRDFIRRMDKMRQDMDRIFNDSFAEFRLSPEHKGYFDEFNFGSSVDIKEEGSNYIVTAYLPERDMQNVNATVEGQTLKIEAKAETTSGQPADKAKPAMTQKAQYMQILTLPGPVQVDKIKVDRKEGILTVTLPKA